MRPDESSRLDRSAAALVIVAGDTVLCCRDDARNNETHVIELRPRRNALFRSNLRGGAEPIVANLSQLS